MITDLQFGDAFVKGKCYRRKRIHELYKGQEQSEISTPKAYPYIFIFTKESGEEYGTQHGWNEDKTVFYYTGEGQRGTMQLIKGNKALMDHLTNGETIYLFQYVEPGIVEFLDEMTYINHQLEIMWDAEENFREAIIFELVRNSVIDEAVSQIDLKHFSLHELRHISETSTNIYKRTAAMQQYALTRAGGICEACGTKAPFMKRDGTPFLEIHHLTRLSDSGLNHPDKVAAICPNCHSRVHIGEDAKEYNEKLGQKVAEKESFLFV
ncbi:HNH endonuclease [Priestia megaterium]|nr:HNH endonuclease [Priestia megaterium]